MNKHASSLNAAQMALAAIFTALSVVLLYFACMLPSGRLGLTAAAGFFPAATVVSCGLKAGLLCYGGSGLLALFLVSDKGLAMLYLLFFGLYPIVKGWIEKRRRLPVELCFKFAFFNLMFSLVLRVASALLLSLLPFGRASTGLLYLLGNAVFLIYDFGLSKVICFYQKRMDQVLRKR